MDPQATGYTEHQSLGKRAYARVDFKLQSAHSSRIVYLNSADLESVMSLGKYSGTQSSCSFSVRANLFSVDSSLTVTDLQAVVIRLGTSEQVAISDKNVLQEVSDPCIDECRNNYGYLQDFVWLCRQDLIRGVLILLSN